MIYAPAHQQAKLKSNICHFNKGTRLVPQEFVAEL